MQKAESANKALVSSQDSLRLHPLCRADEPDQGRLGFRCARACSICSSRPSQARRARSARPRVALLAQAGAQSSAPSVNFRGLVRQIIAFQLSVRTGACSRPSMSRLNNAVHAIFSSTTPLTGRLLHKIPFDVPNKSNSGLYVIELSGDGKVVALGIRFPVTTGNRVSGTSRLAHSNDCLEPARPARALSRLGSDQRNLCSATGGREWRRLTRCHRIVRP